MGEKVFFLSDRDRCAQVYQHECKMYKLVCKIYKHVCKTDGGAAVQKSAKSAKSAKCAKHAKCTQALQAWCITPPPAALTFLSLQPLHERCPSPS